MEEKWRWTLDESGSNEKTDGGEAEERKGGRRNRNGEKREREMGEVLPDLSAAPKADLPVRPLVNYTAVLVLKHRYHNRVDYHEEK